VGLGRPNGIAGQHALLWKGSAASVVDLHPSGFVDSEAKGVSHRRQIGDGNGEDGHVHALLWSGSAASVVDLNVFLPAGLTEAIATGIDAEGRHRGPCWLYRDWSNTRLSMAALRGSSPSRMSGFRASLMDSACAVLPAPPNQVSVGDRHDVHRLLQETTEEKSTGPGSATVKTGRVLIHSSSNSPDIFAQASEVDISLSI